MPIKADWVEFKIGAIKALALNESGVYEIGKKRGDVVLYIGKSDTSIRSRLLTHKAKVVFQGCTHFSKRKTDPDAATEAEAKLIEAFRKSNNDKPPKLNTQKPKTRDDFWRG